jgi:hypothetical protein
MAGDGWVKSVALEIVNRFRIVDICLAYRVEQSDTRFCKSRTLGELISVEVEKTVLWRLGAFDVIFVWPELAVAVTLGGAMHWVSLTGREY